MKITKVQLHNVTQHTDVTHEITEDVVGIVGQNGSGKSNFASAIAAAVTGEFGKKKKDLITYGKKDGFIHVEGIIKTIPFQIERHLNTTEAWLKYGEETINGADAVTDKLLSLLGCDKSFLPNMVFVSQQDILGLLFGRPAERNKMLQKFFGLEKAAKLEQMIGSWKSNISYPAIIDEAQSTAAIENLTDLIGKQKDEIASRVDRRDELVESLGESNEERIGENLTRAKEKETLEKDLEYHKVILVGNKNNLEWLSKPEFEESDLEKQREKLRTLQEESGGLTELMQILSVADGLQDAECGCSICGGELSPLIKESMSRRIKESKDRLKQIATESHVISSMLSVKTSKLDNYSKQLYKLTKDISSGESSVEKYSALLSHGVWPKFHSSRYQDGLNAINKDKEELRSLKNEIKLIQENITAISNQISNHEKDLESSKLVKAKFSGTKIHESRVSRIRDVFRHDGISRRYVNYKINQMASSINQYLENFGAKYRVSVGSDNDFICNFPGKSIPATDLSCGQKVALSLAFRFAACEIFSTGVDMIVLDEPTTWLDRETILNFKDIIESVSELSDSKNLQVLIVTHERSLMPYFRQTIEF